MDKQKILLLDVLKNALSEDRLQEISDSADYEQIIYMAKQHSVLSLLYDVVSDCSEIEAKLKQEVTLSANKTIQQSYRLLFLSRYLITELMAEGIPTVLLKGVGTSSFYRVPELRKSGDVDLLLLEVKKVEDACRILENLGCRKIDNQPSLHHIVFENAEGIEIELHTMLAEPFDNREMNQYLENIQSLCSQNIWLKDCMGIELPILQTAYHGYELLLHMLQHFLRSGFGLKLLCDWVVFWNRDIELSEQRKYLQLVEESGIKGFSDMVTLSCYSYLGLKREYVDWMKLPENFDVESFMAEILEAEEFGKSAGDRMVVLRGTKITDYFREFHHQMQLNFPQKSKNWLYWPALWTITMYRFLRNNLTIRKVSSIAILKKARQRSKMVEQMELFGKKGIKKE